MKKLSYIILSLLLLYSCSDNMDMLDGDSTQGDTLSIAVKAESPTTRADLTLSYDDLNGVALYGYCTTQATTIMDNAYFTKSASNEWSYSGVGNEPTWSYDGSADLFSFFGYAPYTADTSAITASPDNLSVEYDMLTDDFDLLLACRTNMLRPTGGMVSLNFKHALAAVKIDVSSFDKVSSVKISGLLTLSGSTSFSASGDITWDVTEPETCNINVPIGEYLMVIPQSLPTDDEALKVTISFTDGSEDEVRTISTTSIAKWDQSVIYNYVITNSIDGVEDNYINVDKLIGKNEDGTDNYDDIIKYITSVLGDSDGEYTYFIIEGDVSEELLNEIFSIKVDDTYVVTGLDLTDANIKSVASGDGTDLDDYSDVFPEWDNITTLVLPKYIETIDGETYKMFEGWSNIEILDMSATAITTISKDSMKDIKSNSPNLDVIIFPKGLTEIEGNAFTEANYLGRVYYWTNNITIEEKAFEKCNSLTQVYYYGDTTPTNVHSSAYENSVTTYLKQTYSYLDDGSIVFATRTD